MNRYGFGLIAAVTAVILGGTLPAQAQEPGVALQRQLTEARIREGRGEDIVRGPQSDLPLDRFVAANELRFVNPGGGSNVQRSRTLVASPFSDTLINEVDSSKSVLRQITSRRGPNSDR